MKRGIVLLLLCSAACVAAVASDADSVLVPKADLKALHDEYLGMRNELLLRDLEIEALEKKIKELQVATNCV